MCQKKMLVFLFALIEPSLLLKPIADNVTDSRVCFDYLGHTHTYAHVRTDPTSCKEAFVYPVSPKNTTLPPHTHAPEVESYSHHHNKPTQLKKSV